MTLFESRQESDGTWSAYRDDDHVSGDYATEDETLSSLFPSFGYGMYPILYLTDGDYMCGDCARDAYVYDRDAARAEALETAPVDWPSYLDPWEPDTTAQDAFRLWTHGNEYGDGVVAMATESDPPARGCYCEGHSGFVPGCEPSCSDCAREIDHDLIHRPIFEQVNGDYLLCARCLAERVVSGEATKTGKSAYRVDHSDFAGGNYASTTW